MGVFEWVRREAKGGEKVDKRGEVRGKEDVRGDEVAMGGEGKVMGGERGERMMGNRRGKREMMMK